jgi:hypothetical protein
VLSAAAASVNALTATPDSLSRSAAALLLLPNKIHTNIYAVCLLSGGATNFTTLRSAQSESAIEHRIRVRHKQSQVAVISEVILGFMA